MVKELQVCASAEDFMAVLPDGRGKRNFLKGFHIRKGVISHICDTVINGNLLDLPCSVTPGNLRRRREIRHTAASGNDQRISLFIPIEIPGQILSDLVLLVNILDRTADPL